MMADLFDKAAKAKENLEKEVVKEEIERKSFEIRQLALEYSDLLQKASYGMWVQCTCMHGCPWIHEIFFIDERKYNFLKEILDPSLPNEQQQNFVMQLCFKQFVCQNERIWIIMGACKNFFGYVYSWCTKWANLQY